MISKNVFCIIPIIALSILVNGQNNALIKLNNTLNDVLVKDQFSPPAASRIIAYCNLAYYNTTARHTSAFTFGCYPAPGSAPLELDAYTSSLAARMAFIQTARQLTFSSQPWDQAWDKMYATDSLPSPARWQTALSVVQIELTALQTRFKNDGFKKRLTLKKYEVSTDTSKYQLTPPTYKTPVEPHWGTQKPFLITQPDSFSVQPDFVFSAAPRSSFYRMNLKIYKSSNRLSEKHKRIALYWDCNPVQVQMIGHTMQYNFRMTPASHWTSIMNQLFEKSDKSEMEIAHIYAITTMAMADAFIVCWKDKYVYNSIRPVSYVNKYIDQQWSPYIETPNFPEFPSGHSTVSMVAATVLEAFLSKNLNFTDSSQVPYNQPPQHFKSLYAAAIQAGVSRYYGGIHYLPSIQAGWLQGEKIAQHILLRYPLSKNK